MAEIGMIGKRTRRVLRMGRHGDLLSLNRPSSAHRAERRFAKLNFKQVGFYPFRGPDASPTHPHGITNSSTGRRRRDTKTGSTPYVSHEPLEKCSRSK